MMSLSPKSIAFTMFASERSIAVVISPPVTPAIRKPTGSARSVSWFSIKTNCAGSFVPTPSARMNAEPPVEPVAVVIVKLASVVVLDNVNAISRASVVAIVFPPLYAACNENVAPPHFVTLSLASRQSVVPATPGVVSPVNVKNESLSVLTVTPSVPVGENVDAPFASNVLFAVSAPPNVPVPSTSKSLFTVVVPVAAPSEITVASPPMFTVVALVLKREAVPAVVVMSPPFNAKSPLDVMLPVNVEIPSTVKVPFAEMLPAFESVIPVSP